MRLLSRTLCFPICDRAEICAVQGSGPAASPVSACPAVPARPGLERASSAPDAFCLGLYVLCTVLYVSCPGSFRLCSGL